MAGKYELWLTTDRGVRLSLLDNAVWFSATRVVNGIGTFSMSLPPSFDASLLAPDRMVQVWRAPEGGRLSLWRVYFVRKWRFLTQGSRQVLLLWGRDGNDLLRRRIAAAFTDEAESEKTDFADDMMKEIVTEALADGVAPTPDAGTRAWPDLSVQADLGIGPTLTRSFAWQRLDRLMSAIGQAAREAGTEVFFDIVPVVAGSDSISFEFRTYTGQPGADRAGVVFDQERGNLKEPSLEFDYTNEVNYVYGGGQGQESEREVQQSYDAVRYSISQWNRCEGFVNASSQAEADGVREMARSAVEAGRPRRRFGAIPVDTEGTRFGRDWDHGDRVTARYRGFEFDTIIRVTNVTVRDEHETVTARLEYED